MTKSAEAVGHGFERLSVVDDVRRDQVVLVELGVMGPKVGDAHPVDVACPGAAGQGQRHVQGADLQAFAAEVARSQAAADRRPAPAPRRRSRGGRGPWPWSAFGGRWRAPQIKRSCTYGTSAASGEGRVPLLMRMADERLLIITPVRNEGAHIEQVADALAAQTHRPERWLVVDDGSTDETPQILERLAKSLEFMEVVATPPGFTPEAADRLAVAAAPRAFNYGLSTVDTLGVHPHRQARRRHRAAPRLLRGSSSGVRAGSRASASPEA